MSDSMQYPDPAVVATNAYTLLIENDRVRVFDVHFKPGEKAVMHRHPDHVVYVVVDSKLRLTLGDQTRHEFQLKAGQSLWIDAGPHETENIGTTPAHNVVVELKK
jgi:quercetin dioxygenase-like cupin family protein